QMHERELDPVESDDACAVTLQSRGRSVLWPVAMRPPRTTQKCAKRHQTRSVSSTPRSVRFWPNEVANLEDQFQCIDTVDAFVHPDDLVDGMGVKLDRQAHTCPLGASSLADTVRSDEGCAHYGFTDFVTK